MAYPKKKILFITEQKYDWVTDHVFHGLRDLGHEVIDFPPKPTYHLAPEAIDATWHHNFPIKSSLPVSSVPFARLKRWVETGEIDTILVDAKSYRLKPRPFSNLLRLVKSRFRYSGERYGWRHLKRFRRGSNTVVAAIDGVDEASLDLSRSKLVSQVDVYFKRELPLNPEQLTADLPAADRRRVQEQSAKFRPIPIGINLDKFRESFQPAENRIHDVTCLMSPANHPLRQKAMDLLAKWHEQRRFRCRLNPGGGLDGRGMSRPEYFRTLSESRIALSIDGFGWDCIRHYEIPAAGAVLLVTEPTIRTHRFFRNGESCVFLRRDLGDLDEKLENLLLRPERMESLRHQARQHLQAHLSHTAIAKYVLDVTSCERRTLNVER